MRAAVGLQQGELGCRHPPHLQHGAAPRQGGILPAGGAEIGPSQSSPALGVARLHVGSAGRELCWLHGTQLCCTAGPWARSCPAPHPPPSPPWENDAAEVMWLSSSRPTVGSRSGIPGRSLRGGAELTPLFPTAPFLQAGRDPGQTCASCRSGRVGCSSRSQPRRPRPWVPQHGPPWLGAHAAGQGEASRPAGPVGTRGSQQDCCLSSQPCRAAAALLCWKKQRLRCTAGTAARRRVRLRGHRAEPRPRCHPVAPHRAVLELGARSVPELPLCCHRLPLRVPGRAWPCRRAPCPGFPCRLQQRRPAGSAPKALRGRGCVGGSGGARPRSDCRSAGRVGASCSSWVRRGPAGAFPAAPGGDGIRPGPVLLQLLPWGESLTSGGGPSAPQTPRAPFPP